MSLIPCPECGHQVSAGASACPECGFPFDEASAANEVRPSMPVCPAIGNAPPLRVNAVGTRHYNSGHSPTLQDTNMPAPSQTCRS
jgi:hypothetical protein